jgi:carbohydrate-selective porin OprB
VPVQIANARETLLESAPPGVNPTKLDRSARDHLFGDRGGFRAWLANTGITYNLDFTSESVYNASAYLIRPGGTSAVPNSFLVGAKMHADF